MVHKIKRRRRYEKYEYAWALEEIEKIIGKRLSKKQLEEVDGLIGQIVEFSYERRRGFF